jgi:hypothetical protein
MSDEERRGSSRLENGILIVAVVLAVPLWGAMLLGAARHDASLTPTPVSVTRVGAKVWPSPTPSPVPPLAPDRAEAVPVGLGSLVMEPSAYAGRNVVFVGYVALVRYVPGDTSTFEMRYQVPGSSTVDTLVLFMRWPLVSVRPGCYRVFGIGGGVVTSRGSWEYEKKEWASVIAYGVEEVPTTGNGVTSCPSD